MPNDDDNIQTASSARMTRIGITNKRSTSMKSNYAAEVDKWTKANSEWINMLRPKLLAIGGDRVSPQPEPFISLLAEYGEFFEDWPVKLHRGERNRCHTNVARLWIERRPRSRIVSIGIGYGLGGRQHMATSLLALC
jgi:hypothetical protein